MMFPDYPDIVTVPQLQKMLSVSRANAYKLVRDGYIPAVKIAGKIKIPKVNVINFVMDEEMKNSA